MFCEREGKKYIAGYIAFCFKSKYPDFGEKTCDKSIYESKESPWIFALSRGGLTVPSIELVNKIEEFENFFDSIHGCDICRKPNVIKQTVEAICRQFPSFPAFMRIRTLNENLKVVAESIKARNAQKRKHFTT